MANSLKGAFSYDNEFRYCYFSHSGAVFTLIDTSLEEMNSVYSLNAAMGAGVILCDDCNIKIENVSFLYTF